MECEAAWVVAAAAAAYWAAGDHGRQEGRLWDQRHRVASIDDGACRRIDGAAWRHSCCTLGLYPRDVS
jgi:hypothetical protein